MKNKKTLSLALGILISAIALYFALRNVPFRDLLEYLGSVNYIWVIPATFLVVVAFGLRAVRWHIILTTTEKVKYWNAFHPMMIGFMINCILPGRVGEVARPAILKHREKVPFTTGLATVAAERVFDIILLVGLFALVFTTVDIDPNINITFGDHHLNRDTLVMIGGNMVKLCVVMIAGVILISFDRVRTMTTRVIDAIPGFLFFIPAKGRAWIKTKLCRTIVNLMESFAAGFALVKHPLRVIKCLGVSILIWLVQGISYYAVAMGCPGIDLSFAELFAVLIIICFFIALPSAPGFWGLWEWAGVFAMSLFGIPANEAFGYTLTNHVVQMLPVIVIGFISATITGINIRQATYPSTA